MNNQNRFVIKNTMPAPLIVYVEPEGTNLLLNEGEAVQVQEVFEDSPSIIKVSSENGLPAISVWPGDGELTVQRVRSRASRPGNGRRKLSHR